MGIIATQRSEHVLVERCKVFVERDANMKNNQPTIEHRRIELSGRVGKTGSYGDPTC